MNTRAPTTIEHDYAVLTNGAGLLDRSQRGMLDVLGEDAGEFLQGQVTNDVEALGAGQGCYVAMLNPKGHVLADARVLALGPAELWLDTEAAALEAVLADLRMYKIGRRVEIADRSGERSLLSLIGPAAAGVARKALSTSIDLPEVEHDFVETELASVPVLVVRTDLGLDVFGPAAQAGAATEALVSSGAEIVGPDAAEIVRIEQGRPRHGVDMTVENLPAEAGIVDRAVSFTKGCYVGQEPVARMHYKGRPNRHLRGLASDDALSGGEELLMSGRSVGRVTSATVSPALGPVALAIVRREVAPGDEVSVGEHGRSARVVELPFKRP